MFDAQIWALAGTEAAKLAIGGAAAPRVRTAIHSVVHSQMASQAVAAAAELCTLHLRRERSDIEL